MTLNEFDIAFLTHKVAVLRSLNKLTFDKDVAYDLLMETYVKLRSNLEAINNNKSIAGLLYITARNSYISSKRKEKQAKQYERFVKQDSGNSNDNKDSNSKEIANKVYSIANKGFNDKDYKERVVLELYYEKGLAFSKIATITTVGRNALMSENKKLIAKLSKNKDIKEAYYE